MIKVIFCRNVNEDTLNNAKLIYGNVNNNDIHFIKFDNAHNFMVSNGYESVFSEEYCTDELCGEVTYYINRNEITKEIGEDFIPEDVIRGFYSKNDAPCIIDATVVDDDFLSMSKKENINEEIHASDVAYFFLYSQNANSGDVISYLTLQKLCYFAQGLSLAILGKPLFCEKIIAGVNGPICKALRKNFENEFWLKDKDFLDNNKSYKKIFSPDQLKILNDVKNTYGQFAGWKLQELILEDSPWSITSKKSKNNDSNSEIQHETMKKYFTKLISERNKN